MDRTRKLVHTLTEEQLHHAVAPDKNRGIYLLGHLVAYHDALGALMGLPHRTYPEWDAVFLHNPDQIGQAMPSVAELKTGWDTVHGRLASYFAQFTPAEWLIKHTAVTDEEFARQPHRNKLNVLLSRTNHLSYHLGQLMLLK